MAENGKDDDGIYRVDTVPPPAGEGDAYNAPTRVGPMAKSAIDEMMRLAAKAEQEVKEPSSPAAAKPAPVAEPAAPALAAAAPIEKVYDEVDEDHAATLLNPRAKPPMPAPPRPTDDALLGLEAKSGELAPPELKALAPAGTPVLTRVLMIVFALIALGLVAYVLARR